MAIFVAISALEPAVTHPEGNSWDVDTDGNLHVYDAQNKRVGVHARGEWQNARTVELVSGNTSSPGRPVRDNPQA